MKNIYSTLVPLLAVVTLTNCSPKGFDSASSTSSAATNNGSLSTPSNGSTPTTPPSLANPVASLDLQGQVDSTNSTFGNALTFDFDKVRGEFIVMIPMPSGVYLTPVGSFSQYPDITFSPIIDASGRMKFGVRIPVKYIVKGLQFIIYHKLELCSVRLYGPDGKYHIFNSAAQVKTPFFA